MHQDREENTTERQISQTRHFLQSAPNKDMTQVKLEASSNESVTTTKQAGTVPGWTDHISHRPKFDDAEDATEKRLCHSSGRCSKWRHLAQGRAENRRRRLEDGQDEVASWEMEKIIAWWKTEKHVQQQNGQADNWDESWWIRNWAAEAMTLVRYRPHSDCSLFSFVASRRSRKRPPPWHESG